MQSRKVISKPQKESLVSPVIAAILSAIIPGLGQILARVVNRGLIILASFVTSLGLLIWRIATEGSRYTGWRTVVSKAYKLNPFLYAITALMVITYIYGIVDAYLTARPGAKKSKAIGMIFLIILVFFMQGWEIGQIDMGALFRDADEAVPALSKVVWPWEKAISYPEEYRTTIIDVQTPCTDVPFPAGEIKTDEPYLIADPTCGVPSVVEVSQGTEFHVVGGNFVPGKPVEFWWKDSANREFHHRVDGDYLIVTPDKDGSFEVSVIMPYRTLTAAAEEGVKVWQIQARQLISVGKAEFSEELKLAVEKMIETIFIGMMATFFGIILAIPVSFIAARNLMSHSPVTMAIYYLVRTILNIIRSIEPLIWAIIAVIVVGLGPFAGILALTLHSLAALAKLYSEAIESIDSGQIEAIQATGANWFQVVSHAVIPQIIPPFVSFTIYRWDINIRMSTVIGFVGGGGIGYLLAQWIRILDYRSAGIAVWFIAITVAILDFVSADIRERFV
ncbi:phosphonate ABC transporter, permease protein PhnE [Pelolinea submarina]|uniref:Phosphonate transport system permease protein n=1 Tax=Pelolinea submarina TaxID=913107 RepID=A0A347ZT88_9CHLR|nr:phosphonate ABC transporter, permease protein PhnE [Pelolinea submarina]REG10906.1 phosphonate transport system permease protein [Pelolinea submarina]BBB48519.1 phosphonate transport system permease protein [Pelolinea submarina]